MKKFRIKIIDEDGKEIVKKILDIPDDGKCPETEFLPEFESITEKYEICKETSAPNELIIEVKKKESKSDLSLILDRIIEDVKRGGQQWPE